MEVALGAFEDENYESDQENLSLKPATTALEYLRRVQQEAAHCPDVVVAPGYEDQIKQRERDQAPQIKTILTPVSKDYLPLLDWQYEQAAHFAELRQSLNRYKAVMSKTLQNAEQSLILPKLSCPDHWCRFCLGDKSLNEVRRRRGQTYNDDSNQENASGNEETQLRDEGNEPLLSIMTRLGQVAISDILEYHVSWLQQLGFSERQGKWIYALLACLEKPLLPNVASLLRNLARRCADLRASLPSKDDERLAALNLIITIVTRYFDQADLADER